MGNFEKLVVLTVLFVAAIVLAISFNRGGGEVEASNPLSAAQQALPSEQGVTPGDVTPVGQPIAPKTELAGQAQDTSLLLNAGAESVTEGAVDATPGLAKDGAPVGLSVEPQSDPSHRILRSTNGLRPSFAEDYMVYTAVAGDTWSLLAQRFYQDGRYTRNLRQANDDLAELVSGSSILVPVYDFLPSDADLQPGSEALATGAPAKPADQQPAPKTTPERSAVGTAEYEVQSGDTLSDISLAVFGTATRWKEIFDANRDVLKKPEWLQVGMKLKIPAGGKLPEAKLPGAATAAKTDVKPAAKPKTTTASTTPAAAPKKKKVN